MGKHKGSYRLEDLDIDKRIILKWNQINRMLFFELYLSGS
jgi:hypothetical protein